MVTYSDSVSLQRIINEQVDFINTRAHTHTQTQGYISSWTCNNTVFHLSAFMMGKLHEWGCFQNSCLVCTGTQSAQICLRSSKKKHLYWKPSHNRNSKACANYLNKNIKILISLLMPNLCSHSKIVYTWSIGNKTT